MPLAKMGEFIPPSHAINLTERADVRIPVQIRLTLILALRHSSAAPVILSPLGVECCNRPANQHRRRTRMTEPQVLLLHSGKHHPRPKEQGPFQKQRQGPTTDCDVGYRRNLETAIAQAFVGGLLRPSHLV